MQDVKAVLTDPAQIPRYGDRLCTTKVNTARFVDNRRTDVPELINPPAPSAVAAPQHRPTRFDGAQYRMSGMLRCCTFFPVPRIVRQYRQEFASSQHARSRERRENILITNQRPNRNDLVL